MDEKSEPEFDVQAAAALAERLCANVARSVVDTPAGKVKVTTSIGVIDYEAGELDIQPALVRADKLLYDAKRQGRVCVAFEVCA